MGKRQPQQTVVRSFDIDGITYTDGDRLQIITPELGLLLVVIAFAAYSNDDLITMTFTDITTPLPCRTGKKSVGNASLKFSCARIPATGDQPQHHRNTLALNYFCACPSTTHTDQITWHDVTFELGVIRAARRGVDPRDRWRRVRHSVVDDWQNLQPVTYDELVREPISTDDKGQFDLFNP